MEEEKAAMAEKMNAELTAKKEEEEKRIKEEIEERRRILTEEQDKLAKEAQEKVSEACQRLWCKNRCKYYPCQTDYGQRISSYEIQGCLRLLDEHWVIT